MQQECSKAWMGTSGRERCGGERQGDSLKIEEETEMDKRTATARVVSQWRSIVAVIERSGESTSELKALIALTWETFLYRKE